MIDSNGSHHIPPLRLPGLTRYYDTVVHYSTREATFRRLIIQRADAKPTDRVLDVGSGTGSLLMTLQERASGARSVGAEIDAAAITIAAAKTSRSIPFVQASATTLPFETASFDRVFMTLVLHHLEDDDKVATLAEARRVLCRDGSLHVADWRRGTNLALRAMFLGVRLLDGMTTTRQHAVSSLAEIVKDAGLRAVEEYRVLATPFGSIGLLSAARA